MSLLLLFQGQQKAELPELTLKALLTFAGRDIEGQLIEAVALPWFEVLQIIQRNPRAAFEIDPRKWEEIIAGAYRQAGFDEVILTPRSRDKGRDVIATRHGVGSIRIFDQVSISLDTWLLPKRCGQC